MRHPPAEMPPADAIFLIITKSPKLQEKQPNASRALCMSEGCCQINLTNLVGYFSRCGRKYAIWVSLERKIATQGSLLSVLQGRVSWKGLHGLASEAVRSVLPPPSRTVHPRFFKRRRRRPPRTRLPGSGGSVHDRLLPTNQLGLVALAALGLLVVYLINAALPSAGSASAPRSPGRHDEKRPEYAQ
jgi:hypothetical protein